MSDTAETVYCETCQREAPLGAWFRVMARVPVVAEIDGNSKGIGYVAVLRHSVCHDCTAVWVSDTMMAK